MTRPETSRTNLAIVGMAGRFPDADDVPSLWQALCQGHEAVRRFDEGELRRAGVPASHIADPGYMPYGTTVSGADAFDAEFFGMSPADAAATDPQHRLFMECGLRALEDAGIPSGGVVGVYASVGYPDYLMRNVWPSGVYTDPDLPYSVRIGNQIDFLASRLCHQLDLRGPGVGIQTSCSSSLVAVEAACAALHNRRCDVAVVGAAVLRIPHPSGYRLAEGGFWSRDGHCRPFDAEASGFVPGNGCAVLVLKREADARADHDRIYAFISGIGVNNDGSDKTSYTAPSTSGQIAAITRALADSGIPSTDIGYIEGHGSGTRLGDPIEVDALIKAYSDADGIAMDCALGSIKANVGHFSAACGVVGLVKTAMILKHQLIPPQINFREPNPLLELSETNLVVHTAPHRVKRLKAAAVSSFGVGGTNAHIVLSAPPPDSVHGRPAPAERIFDLPLSARTDDDLKTVAADLDHHLRTHEVRIDDLAYTLSTGRRTYRSGIVLHARTIEETHAELRRLLDANGALSVRMPRVDDRVAISDSEGAIKIRLPGHPLRPRRHWISAPTSTIELTQASVPPSGDLLDRVVGIFRNHLGMSDIGPDDEFDAAGGTSLKAVELVDAIIDELGATLTLGAFIDLRTPRRVAERLRTWPAGNLVDPTVVKLRDGRPGEEIFFIYPVNGSVFCYHQIVQHTTFNRPVYAIAYPFDDTNPPDTISAMAARCVQDLRTVAPCGPYRLAGYSLGGNLALEIAHQLERAGDTVRDIVMIDPLPTQAYPRPAVERDYIRASAINLAYFLGLPLPEQTADTIDGVLSLLRDPTWSTRTEQTIRRFAETAVRNAVAITAADTQPVVAADLTLLVATERRNPVYDIVGIRDVPSTLWRDHTTGTLTFVDIPGNHYTLYTDPTNFARLADALDSIYTP